MGNMFDFSRYGRRDPFKGTNDPSTYYYTDGGVMFFGLQDDKGPMYGFWWNPKNTNLSFLGEFNTEDWSNSPYNGKMFMCSITDQDFPGTDRYALEKGVATKDFDDSGKAQSGDGRRRLEEMAGHSMITRILREERRASA